MSQPGYAPGPGSSFPTTAEIHRKSDKVALLLHLFQAMVDSVEFMDGQNRRHEGSSLERHIQYEADTMTFTFCGIVHNLLVFRLCFTCFQVTYVVSVIRQSLNAPDSHKV